jgi:cyclopropane fatty-acyl-phospholipid synthase-like methyltransferase
MKHFFILLFATCLLYSAEGPNKDEQESVLDMNKLLMRKAKKMSIHYTPTYNITDAQVSQQLKKQAALLEGMQWLRDYEAKQEAISHSTKKKKSSCVIN